VNFSRTLRETDTFQRTGGDNSGVHGADFGAKIHPNDVQKCYDSPLRALLLARAGDSWSSNDRFLFGSFVDE